MSFSLINGLPAHVLIVHFVVIFVPLSALAVVVGAIWPSAARRMGIVLPLLGLVTLASVPLATQAGGWLEQHVDSDALVRKHTELGDGLLPWAAALFVLATVIWWTTRRSAAAEPAHRGRARATSSPLSMILRVVAAVLCIGVAAGAVVDVYRIGDSGARAAWHDGFSQTAKGDHGGNG
ncbi:DUF2231 domain-containing protein [Streptomyces gilvosporeus]|uniref:DUF2231 domain-containing protein n=1 Tax=Streptomyces gilvosporeus TaxID=553510 RepID=A0A1V0TL04_9ACTN|nr:DUF2231 domain-containing protein [Streptomyces gilvosporeus]ARF53583.1 hypothetical protein B1H19_04775 [Streptomyces gilvosporeus]